MPSRSVVVAFTLTRPMSIADLRQPCAHRRLVRADFGRLADDRDVNMRDGVAGLRDKLGACARNRSEEAPFQRASDGGKWSPMSPAAMLPSSASTSAWIATSASLCPDRPWV
jgi:hypothetical protein